MIASILKNKKGIFLMICSSLCACVGQLLWKMSVEKGILFLLAGFGLYGVGALVMIVAYRYGKLSILQPILGLNYVLSIIFGAIFLGEPVGILKGVGVLTIICGIVFIAGGDKE